MLKSRREILDAVKEALVPLQADGTISALTLKDVSKAAIAQFTADDAGVSPDALVAFALRQAVALQADIAPAVSAPLLERANALVPQDAPAPAAEEKEAAGDESDSDDVQPITAEGLAAFIQEDRAQRAARAAAAAAEAKASQSAAPAAAAPSATVHNIARPATAQASAAAAPALTAPLAVAGLGKVIGDHALAAAAEYRATLAAAFQIPSDRIRVPVFPGGDGLPPATLGSAIVAFASRAEALAAVGAAEGRGELVGLTTAALGMNIDALVKMHEEDCREAARSGPERKRPEQRHRATRFENAADAGPVLATDDLYGDLDVGGADKRHRPEGY